MTVNSTSGLVTHIPAMGADHVLKLTTTSGLFSGTFTYGAGVIPAYKGALLNKAGGTLNGGLRLLPEPPARHLWCRG